MLILEDHKSWIASLRERVLVFLDTLSRSENSFNYNPVAYGITPEGRELELGFSCYALKIKYILKDPSIFNESVNLDWAKYLNSFQVESGKFPRNSFVDEKFLKYQAKFEFNKSLKNNLKKILNHSSKYDYLTNEQKVYDFIKAESKQAISTLHEIKSRNLHPYLDFPKNEHEINNYLQDLNWAYPWNAGAQFSALCVFSSTQPIQKKQDVEKELKKFIKSISNDVNGLYFVGNVNSTSELINGAMKVLTGLDWLGESIHYPEKLIDYCLNSKPNSEGCDLVDIVYVLYRCSLETDYKKNEIEQYLIGLIYEIKLHYHDKEGGFSYFKNKSQTHYYGVNVSKGLNTPDIHGTILIVWALSMIFKIIKYDNIQWNILKP